MESAEAKVMPAWVEEMVRLSYRLPVSQGWKRLRIAVTETELNEYREYMRGNPDFVHAIRAIPLQLEAYPLNPAYILEHL